MKVVLQRVKEARVTIEGKVKGEIKKGILVFVGIENADGAEDITWLAGKISRLRIFRDQQGVMNLSVKDVNGEFLIVSQFTLHASIKKGNRPYYGKSADPEKAKALYFSFIREMELCLGKKAETGDFGAIMEVSLINDGPVTILMDSKNIE